MNINYSDFGNTTRFHNGRTPFITFKPFDELDFVRHGFSTRLGGVSEGEYESMNLTFTRSDEPKRVSENFRLMGNALGIDVKDMVYSQQTHTTNVLVVDSSYKGMGITRERSFADIDGLITAKPGVCLVTSYADCVPLFFADPVKKVIALSHSGWRGTVGNIGGATVHKMADEFGCNPSDIHAFIGPSICRNCYEVSEDVAEQFAKRYGDDAFDGIIYPVEPFAGKFRLDLWEANRRNLTSAGLLENKIGITDMCTCCNPDILFSHRFTKGRRGGMCGFLQIK